MVDTTTTDAPADEDVLCASCGWLIGATCLECVEPGCTDRTCYGWRHRECLTEDGRAEECDECGAGSGPYGCDC